MNIRRRTQWCGVGKNNAGEASCSKLRQSVQIANCQSSLLSIVIATLLLLVVILAIDAHASDGRREQLIPILGVTMDQKRAGTVAYLILSFEERKDQSGLAVHFKTKPGRFSPMAQTSVEQAIRRAAQSLHVSTDTWSVVLSVPYEGLTVYGNSLSAMVGLSVIALAQGKLVPPDRVMTGTITPEGYIGQVGSVSLKVSGMLGTPVHRVIVPDIQDPTDCDWATPFLMHVYPVGSVAKAYTALTEDDPRP